MVSIGLAASCGVETSCLQRPSIRAGLDARHPMLYASFDESWKACGRRPHLSDGFFAGPGKTTGRLHQHQGRNRTQHQGTAYASLSIAPSGNAPVSKRLFEKSSIGGISSVQSGDERQSIPHGPY
jgi:hypothetical protein